MAASPHIAPLCKDSFLAALDRTSLPPSRLIRHSGLSHMAGRLLLARVYLDLLIMARKSTGVTRLYRWLEADRWTFAASAKVLGAAESDVVVAVIWIGVHAPARF
jgi:hypothetical protein